MAWDQEGHFYFTDVPRALLFKVDAQTGEKTLLDDNTGQANGITFGRMVGSTVALAGRVQSTLGIQ